MSDEYMQIRSQIIDFKTKKKEIDKILKIEFVMFDEDSGRETVYRARKCQENDFINATDIWKRYSEFNWPLICPMDYESVLIS